MFLMHRAGYGTYILSSPTVPTSCWDNNPCAYSDQLPGVCTGAVDSLGHATLSGPCQDVADNQDVFQCVWSGDGDRVGGRAGDIL